MGTIPSDQIDTQLSTARTTDDYQAVVDTLETATDQASSEIKERFRSAVEKIRDAQYQPAEEARLVKDEHAEATKALQDLEASYEATWDSILSAATKRAFPVGRKGPEDAINRRDAMSRVARIDEESDALDMLDRALGLDDSELAAALAREAYRRDWAMVLAELAGRGNLSQQRGAHLLEWVAESSQVSRVDPGAIFAGARFSTASPHRVSS